MPYYIKALLHKGLWEGTTRNLTRTNNRAFNRIHYWSFDKYQLC